MRLAYVFTHAPTDGVDAGHYLDALLGFHRALADAPPPGFHDSWVWRREEAQPYEDWYLVEDWAALGELNEAAVRGARQAPHDRIAPLTGVGAGAIYALRHGVPNASARVRLRISKAIGVPYAEFEEKLLAAVAPQGAVWKRQMVLGPDTEYLVDLADMPASPPGLVDTLDLTPVRPPR